MLIFACFPAWAHLTHQISLREDMSSVDNPAAKLLHPVYILCKEAERLQLPLGSLHVWKGISELFTHCELMTGDFIYLHSDNK